MNENHKEEWGTDGDGVDQGGFYVDDDHDSETEVGIGLGGSYVTDVDEEFAIWETEIQGKDPVEVLWNRIKKNITNSGSAPSFGLEAIRATLDQDHIKSAIRSLRNADDWPAAMSKIAAAYALERNRLERKEKIRKLLRYIWPFAKKTIE